MNPLLADAVGSVIRFALAGVFGYLVTKGVWTEAQASAFLSAAVVGLLTLGWALWTRYRSRVKFLTAAATPYAVSEHQVEKMISDGQAPPAALDKSRVPYLEGSTKVRNDGPDTKQ